METKHVLYSTLTKPPLYFGVTENWLIVTVLCAAAGMYVAFAAHPPAAVKAFIAFGVIAWIFGVYKTSKDINWLEILIARFYVIGSKPKTTDFKGNRYIS